MRYLIYAVMLGLGVFMVWLSYQVGVEVGAAEMRALLHQAHVCVWEDL